MPMSQEVCAGHNHASMPESEAAPVGAATAVNPVCGLTLTLTLTLMLTPETRAELYGGQTFDFCSEKWQAKFKADPWFYASGNSAITNALHLRRVVL